jgi:hypothetical protein
MKEKWSNCTDLTVCNRKDLMADGNYVDKEVMKKKCSITCFRKHTCQDILKLLDRWEWKQAQDLLIK